METCLKVNVVRGRQVEVFATSDVSYKGLSLRMEQEPALRSLLRLRVALPAREIEAHAMVVHVASERDAAGRVSVGVQFWGLAGPERTQWEEFVREVLHTPAPVEDRVTPSGMRVSPALAGTAVPRASSDE